MRAADRRLIATAALAALTVNASGCDWLQKTLECRKLSGVSNEWSAAAESFGDELEADLRQSLEGLNRLDPRSRDSFVQASYELHDASDTLDERVGSFVAEFVSDFESVQLQDPTLIQFREAYVEKVQEMGERSSDLSLSVRNLADLMNDVDPERISSRWQAERLHEALQRSEADIRDAERGISSAVSEEEALVREINAYCRI